MRLNIIVEGQTEETFVRDVLDPYLSNQKIFPVAKCLGGFSKNSYSRIRRETIQWCKQDPNAFVTSLVDVYALPKDFPGLEISKKITDVYAKVNFLETEFGKDINCDNFIPHLQLHEFESLLFSNVDAFRSLVSSRSISELHAIRNNFDSPEHINDNPNTAPSKRILKLFSNYEKPWHGSLISIEIGIDKIREECRHFNNWIKKIEALNEISQTVTV